MKFLKRLLGIVIALIIAIVVFKLLGSKVGFGDGAGKTDLDMSAENISSTVSDNEQQASGVDEDQNNTGDQSNGTEEADSNVVIVTIEEERVFIGEKEFLDADELRSYLEETNNDDKEYEIKEIQSILATHEWVEAVFKALQIPVKQVE